jgi:hypothetical protein
MGFKMHYAECPRCHRVTSHPTARAANLAEQSCLKSHENETKTYTAKHDPRLRATF